MLRNFSVTIVLLCLAVSFLCGEDQSKAIGVTDLLKIQTPGSPRFSPDESKIVYTVKAIIEEEKEKDQARDDKKYSYRTQLWLAQTEGGNPPRQLTWADSGASKPAWHPSGRFISFIRTKDKKSQIFALPLAGGEAFALTDFKSGVSHHRWSPGGDMILFTSTLTHEEIRKTLADTGKETNPPWPHERPNRKFGDTAPWEDEDAKKPTLNPDGSLQEIREWLAKNNSQNNPRIIHRTDLQGENDLEKALEYTHLYTVPFNEEKPETTIVNDPVALTSGYFSYGEGEWTPDGQKIFFNGSNRTDVHPDRNLGSDLFMVNRDGSGFKRFLHLEGKILSTPKVSPDGKTIAFLSDREDALTYAQTTVGTVATDGSGLLWVGRGLDRSVSGLQWSDDSRHLYFTAASNGGFPLYRLRVETGKVKMLSGFETGIRAFQAQSGHLAYVLTEVTNPYELYLATETGENARPLSNHNSDWLRDKKLSRPEHSSFTTEDGFTIDYWIMPPTFREEGKRYPLLLEIHGGPTAMWGPGESSMWHEFQFFTSRGYGIVYSNPRGSGGYGEKFQRGNFQNWGTGPADDVLAAADRAAKLPWVDLQRQVVTGGSYAGYLTAWIVTQDHRFKAAVAQRGVYDLAVFMGEGNAWRLVPFQFGGYPWETKIGPILQANSPSTFVHQIQTPLLIMHSDLDLRTGVSQSEMLYKSLKILGQPVEYVRYPKAGHDLSRTGDPQQRMDRVLRIYEFLKRYSNSETSTENP